MIRVLWAAVCLLCAGAGFSAPAPGASEPGLLGWWRFDEGRGEEALDASGNGGDGEIAGAAWVKGRFGTALRFSGANSYVTLPPVEGLKGSDELTAEAWVYWEGGGRYPNLLSAGAWNPGGILFFVSDDVCSFRMGKPGERPWTPGKDWAEVSAPFLRFEKGRWYHLAATFKRPEIRTYVDGKPAGSAKWDYPVGVSGGITLGHWGNLNACHNGLMDEVKLYSRALSPEEVKMSYEREAPRRAVAAGEKPYEPVIARAEPVAPAVTLENRAAKLLLDRRARVIGVVEKATGKDLAAAPASSLVTLRKGGREYRAVSCSFEDGKLTVGFPGSAGSVVLGVTAKPRYFVFRVLSVSDAEVEDVAFLNLRVKPSQYVSGMAGVASDDASAVCLRVLDIQANATVTGKPPLLRAACYRKYGLEGAGAILAVCSRRDLRPVLQEALPAEGVIHSKLGGPWALDAPANRLSYLFASVSEQNVDAWIELAKRSGMPIIHLSGWERSLGHYEPHPGLFPNGLEGLKRVADKIHAAGLKIGMHTLTGCISPNDPFVTPVPDRRMAKQKVYTLTAALGEKEDVVPVAERPENPDVVWAYASRGNVVQVDDELIQFTGYTKEPPYRFTGCRRGVFGTKAAAHAAGSAVNHLFAYYGAFYPDENTDLVDEVAECIAKVANAGRFDFLYEDGSEGMPGGWHAVSKMRAAIYRRIDHPIRIEASEWGYHSWPFHSCIGAWDHPCWALNRFTDLHCKSNETFRATHLLPGQLGWWAILGPNADHDAEMPEEIEYLCAKALAFDSPLSMQGVSPGGRPPNARQDEYLTTIGRYERLRLAGYFPEAVKEKLRVPGEEFRLSQAPDGTWQLRPTDYLARKVSGAASWILNNRYAAQPARLRVQALYSAAPYDSPEAKLLAEFGKPDEFTAPTAAKEVTCTFAPSTEQVKAGRASACLTATNGGKERRGSWARVSKSFPDEVKLGKCAALGVWIYGDGKGEVLNFQLTDPPQYYHSAWSDHYVDVDFTGWRYFELPLRERDAERHGEMGWPYGGLYQVYRTPLMREHVSALHVYVNNIPPGETVKCFISPVKVLPLVKAKLANPAVAIGGKRVRFPVTLESGQYLEMESADRCTLYDERGEVIRSVVPEGDAPAVSPGENRAEFACDPPEGTSARAKVTVILQGAPLRGAMPKGAGAALLRTECDDPRLIRALDGKQNAWEVICRPTPAKGAAPHLEVELIADRVARAGAGYDSPEALTLESFDDLARFADSPDNRYARYVWDGEHTGVAAKPGVTFTFDPETSVVKVGKSSLRFSATSTRGDNAGWCARGAHFTRPLDLSGYVALGFWVYGDGAGEYLKLQLRDTAGAWQDMVTTIDFTGWRYVEFPLGEGAKIDLKQVEYAILFYNGLPGGKSVTCRVDDIRALRAPSGLQGASLSVGGRKVVFPALGAGERLLYRSPEDCRLYARDGTLKGKVQTTGGPLSLKPGANRVLFGLAGPAADFQVRVLATKVYP